MDLRPVALGDVGPALGASASNALWCARLRRSMPIAGCRGRCRARELEPIAQLDATKDSPTLIAKYAFTLPEPSDARGA